jgi:glycosyltransferase involved in cell wall biosynthesis
MLFSSQILNVLIYAKAFSKIKKHKFIIVTLVPRYQYKEYEIFFSKFNDIKSSNIVFSPIYLRTPDESFKNFFNLITLLHDFKKIVKILAKHKPEVVIGKYIIHSYPLVLFKKLFRFNLYVIASGGDIELHTSLFWKIIRLIIYNNCEKIFSVGNKLKKEILDESGKEAFVIPTGTDPDFFKPLNCSFLRKKYGYHINDFILLTLSLLIPRKGTDQVIRSFSLLKKDKISPKKMIIAGDGPEKRNLLKLSSALKIGGSVIFTGFVSNNEKLELFNIASVYILGSFGEGLPFSLN